MVNWMYGFCNALQRSEMWMPGASSATGVSGGAINAVCLAAGIDVSPSSLYQSELRAALKRKPSAPVDAIRRALEACLPHDVATRLQGRARLAVVLAEGPWRERRPILVDTFDDKEDVIGAVCASAHLPYLMDGKPTASWRGRQYFDAAVLGFGMIHVEGAVHVSTCPPPSYTPPGQTVPGLEPLRWLLHAREGAPSDAHPWLTGEEEQRSVLPSGVVSHAMDIFGFMQRHGAARERYRSKRRGSSPAWFERAPARTLASLHRPGYDLSPITYALWFRFTSMRDSGRRSLWRVGSARARFESVTHILS